VVESNMQILLFIYTALPAVKEFWKSEKIWQSYYHWCTWSGCLEMQCIFVFICH